MAPMICGYRQGVIFTLPTRTINAAGGQGPNPKWKQKKYMYFTVAAKRRYLL